MSAERKVSVNLQELARQLDDALRAIAGERMGFTLIVFPLHRVGHVNYVSNCSRDDIELQLHDLLKHWRTGVPDVPMHNSH